MSLPQTVIQPLGVKISLYPHQLSSIYHMEKLEKDKRINLTDNCFIQTSLGLLSDLSGYGKTLTTIGLISRNKSQFPLNQPFIVQTVNGNHIVSKRYIENYIPSSSNLVIVNQSIIPHWESEIKKSDLTFKKVTKRKDIDSLADTINTFKIILCSHTMYQKLCDKFNNICWERVIYDEPSSLKKLGVSIPISNFIWFITSQPFELFNRKKVGVISHILPETTDILSKLIIKNDDDFVKKSFVMPETNHIRYKSYLPLRDILDGIVSHHIFEMISAENIKGVLRAIGRGHNNNIIEIIKEKKLEKVCEIDMKIEKSETDEELYSLIDKKDTLTDNIDILDERYNSFLNSGCPLCLKAYISPVFLPCCQSIICNECVIKNIKESKKCPLCLIDSITLSYLPARQNPLVSEMVYNSTKGKLVLEMLNLNPTGRFLLFSNHEESFEYLKRVIDKKYIHIELKGKTESREKIISAFKEGKINLLYLNSQFNSTGLDIKEATDIILFHKVSESLEAQILSRANRIGREISLRVHHLD